MPFAQPRSEMPQSATGMRLRFSPFSEAGERWLSFASGLPGIELYHRRRWVELLRETHATDTQVATLEYDSEIAAGCLLARSPGLFGRRLISLPDTESCPPLAVDDRALEKFLALLSEHQLARQGVEIHGVQAPPPWQTVNLFADWKIDMRRPLEALHSALDRDVRRNMRHALARGIKVSQDSSLNYLRRFYLLHLATRSRLGMPPRPFSYLKAMHRIFAPSGSLSIWMATRDDRDVAGLLVLQDGEALYAKVNARSADCPNGANHLIFVDVMDHFAGRVHTLHLGRVDTRNRGLSEFKRRLGAVASPLPYAYLPRAPRNISSEVPVGATKLLSQVVRRLPLWTTRVLGAVVYGFLI